MARDKQHNLRRLEAQRNELNTKGAQSGLPLWEPEPVAYCWPHVQLLITALMCFAVRLLREELQLLQEPGSYVGEVVKVSNPADWQVFSPIDCESTASASALRHALGAQVMGKNKVLVKVHPEGKYVVDLDKSIEMSQVRKGSLTPHIDHLNACMHS